MVPAAKFPMSPPPKNETLAEFTKRYCEAHRADDLETFERYMEKVAPEKSIMGRFGRKSNFRRQESSDTIDDTKAEKMQHKIQTVAKRNQKN